MKIGDRIIYKLIRMGQDTTSDVRFVTDIFKGTVIDIQDPEKDPKWLTHKTTIEFDNNFEAKWTKGRIHSFETDLIEDKIEIDIKETRNHKLKDLGI